MKKSKKKKIQRRLRSEKARKTERKIRLGETLPRDEYHGCCKSSLFSRFSHAYATIFVPYRSNHWSQIIVEIFH